MAAKSQSRPVVSRAAIDGIDKSTVLIGIDPSMKNAAIVVMRVSPILFVEQSEELWLTIDTFDVTAIQSNSIGDIAHNVAAKCDPPQPIFRHLHSWYPSPVIVACEGFSRNAKFRKEEVAFAAGACVYSVQSLLIRIHTTFRTRAQTPRFAPVFVSPNNVKKYACPDYYGMSKKNWDAYWETRGGSRPYKRSLPDKRAMMGAVLRDYGITKRFIADDHAADAFFVALCAYEHRLQGALGKDVSAKFVVGPVDNVIQHAASKRRISPAMLDGRVLNRDKFAQTAKWLRTDLANS